MFRSLVVPGKKLISYSTVYVAEMPTSGDLKSGGCLFFTFHPRNFNEPPHPPKKIDLAPNGNDLGHYMMSYMMYILSKFAC